MFLLDFWFGEFCYHAFLKYAFKKALKRFLKASNFLNSAPATIFGFFESNAIIELDFARKELNAVRSKAIAAGISVSDLVQIEQYCIQKYM